MARRTGYTPNRTESSDDDAKMEAMEKGTKAQGVNTGTAPNLKDLANADESEFDEIMKEMFGGG